MIVGALGAGCLGSGSNAAKGPTTTPAPATGNKTEILYFGAEGAMSTAKPNGTTPVMVPEFSSVPMAADQDLNT